MLFLSRMGFEPVYIESIILSILDFGGLSKTFFKSSAVKLSFKKEIISVLSFQQPIMLLQGNPSFIEEQ
jgi:hypothetical protein